MDRQTDASAFIICPMLCYSNGTDNNWSGGECLSGETLRPGLSQLCKNAVGHLTTNGIYPALQVWSRLYTHANCLQRRYIVNWSSDVRRYIFVLASGDRTLFTSVVCPLWSVAMPLSRRWYIIRMQWEMMWAGIPCVSLEFPRPTCRLQHVQLQLFCVGLVSTVT